MLPYPVSRRGTGMTEREFSLAITGAGGAGPVRRGTVDRPRLFGKPQRDSQASGRGDRLRGFQFSAGGSTNAGRSSIAGCPRDLPGIEDLGALLRESYAGLRDAVRATR